MSCEVRDLLPYHVPNVREAYALPVHQRDWTRLVTEEKLLEHGVSIAHANARIKHGGHLTPTVADQPSKSHVFTFLRFMLRYLGLM